MSIRPQQYPKPPDSEKLTINLGFVDLGSIDLLVRDGFYSNRSDFIRTAIRNQLAAHADTAKQAASRLTLELGMRTFGRQDLEAAQAAGEQLKIRVLGLAVIADDVTPDLAKATIESITVLGALHAPAEVKAALADRAALTYSDKEQTMKLRVLEVMNDALGLVKKSDLSGATALIRKALSGEPAEESGASQRLTVRRRRSSRFPLAVRWAKPCARCASGRLCRRLARRAQTAGRRRISANDS